MFTSHNHAIYVEEQPKVGGSILPALCNRDVADIKMALTTVYAVLNEDTRVTANLLLHHISSKHRCRGLYKI